jgi:beta-barrel assembly-enhancing protease
MSHTIQRTRARHIPFILLALFTLSASLFTACEDGFLSSLLINNAQEVEMGRGVDQQIEAEYQIVDEADPLAQWAIQLVNPLQSASSQFRDPSAINGYKVEVIADNELVNAFAAPGGYTYISTGLIMNATTCAEIAGVMGHELAHVTQRHSVNAITSQFAVEQIAGFFLGDSLIGDAASLIYGFLQSTSFSQDNEAEADSVGLKIAFNAGYNPYGLVDFFEVLLALEGGGSNPLQFLSSHPATADRVRDISNEIQSIYPGQVNRGTKQADGSVVGATQTYECVGTTLTLNQVKDRIRSGQVQTRPGTGGGTTN